MSSFALKLLVVCSIVTTPPDTHFQSLANVINKEKVQFGYSLQGSDPLKTGSTGEEMKRNVDEQKREKENNRKHRKKFQPIYNSAALSNSTI